MKKIWIVLVLLGVSLSLTACFGGEQKEVSSGAASSSASSSEAPKETASVSNVASTTGVPAPTKSASVPTVVEPGTATAGGGEVTTKEEAIKIAKEKMKGDPGVVYMVVDEFTSPGKEGDPPAGDYYLVVGKVENEGNWADLDGLIFVSKANGDTYFGGDSLEKLK